jgi:N-acetylmuramoyl-L-alanine amidase
VELQINGKANAVVHYLPGTTQMEIDIANAVISLPDQDTGERTVQHPLVDHISIAEAPGSPGNVRVQIDTSRIVGYTLTIQQDRLSLDLRMPRNASGALSDKLIVVDAGHGGTATGASGHGPEGTVYEKTITLAIAMRLRALLEQCGARVVVTRDSDVDVPLYDRPKLANTIGADLFISIHNDSTPRLNSASGTTTYYHSTDPSSRALAVCVQDAVRSVTGLPSKGALSDTVLYASGLAVLRNSTMPAVLCEVAYINNNGDRSKLINAAFQDRVARAMCDGLKSYVEGRPRSSSRQIQPEDTPSDAQALQGDDPTH